MCQCRQEGYTGTRNGQHCRRAQTLRWRRKFLSNFVPRNAREMSMPETGSLTCSATQIIPSEYQWAGIAQSVWRQIAVWRTRVRLPAKEQDLFTLQLPDRFWGHKDLDKMDIGGAPFQWVNRSGRETEYSHPSSAEVKNGRAIPPLHYTSSWRGT
jgi:hypothetical protein